MLFSPWAGPPIQDGGLNTVSLARLVQASFPDVSRWEVHRQGGQQTSSASSRFLWADLLGHLPVPFSGVNRVSISISYEADWLGLSVSKLDLAYAHLELQVLAPKGAPLPVTETGYRSEFLDCGRVEASGGLKAFVAGWLDEAARGLTWRVAQAKWVQGDLFG